VALGMSLWELCRRHKKQEPSYWLKSTGRTYGGDKMCKCMNSMYVVRPSP